MRATSPHGEVLSYRGSVVEDRHLVSAAVVDPGGHLLGAVGDPERLILLRSTAKPFQVQPLLDPASAHFELRDEELALACASHTGESRQTSIALGLLARLGLGEEALDCGAHPPIEPARRELLRAGREPSAIHNNCSGKHAGMLAACLARGWPTAGYLEPDHPLQVEIRAVLTALAGFADLPLAIDGCSAPTYGMPLAALATMFARLLEPEAAPAPLRAGLARARNAMQRHPELVGGESVVDTLLMRRFPNLVAKRGAAATYALAARLPTRGVVGVALKVEDGSSEARECALIHLLGLLGLSADDDPALAALGSPILRNCARREVGRLEARFALSAASPTS